MLRFHSSRNDVISPELESDGEHFQESISFLIVWASCCTTSVGSPAGRSLSRSSGWFAVSNHDASDMLTTSGVTELLARAKGKRRFYLEPLQY